MHNKGEGIPYKEKQAGQHAARPLFFDCALISRILFAGVASASAIYLGRPSRTGSICLPPALLLFTAVTGRAARSPEERTVYMAFQPARFISLPVARTVRALLPHDFTLTCFRRRYHFCDTVCERAVAHLPPTR